VAPVTVSAIVVSYRRPDILDACLGSLREALARTGAPAELIVIDNASRDGSLELAAELAPEATVVEMPANLGFAAGAAHGISRSTGEWVLLVNTDVVTEPDAVEQLLAVGRSSPEVGSVAAQMRFAGERAGIINSAGIGIDRLGIAFDRLLDQPVEASETEPVEVFGACGGAALLRRAMLDDVGGLDESFFFSLDDADLAWRAQMRGWRCLYAPAAVVNHEHSATARHGSSLKYFHVGLNRVRMLAKNADGRQLRRYGPAIVGYDLMYVVFAALTDRTLAPLRGRVQGLREWRTYRRAGAARRPVELAPTQGLRAALARRSAWLRNSAVGTGVH
jgi:GT2 family glycosyltransferase